MSSARVAFFIAGAPPFPTEALVNPAQSIRPNWSLRMAARAVMERGNVLELDLVTALFNPVLPKGKTLWPNVMEPIIDKDWKRLTRIGRRDYRRLPVGKHKAKARKAAVRAMKERFGEIIQIRHDWIHNCGRPKNAVQTVTSEQAKARIREVRAVVEVVDEHLMAHRIV
jgi:hypothetical protein